MPIAPIRLVCRDHGHGTGALCRCPGAAEREGGREPDFGALPLRAGGELCEEGLLGVKKGNKRNLGVNKVSIR